MEERKETVLSRYEAPQVEVIEVAVERGFALSSATVGPWGDGGSLGGGEAEEIF